MTNAENVRIAIEVSFKDGNRLESIMTHYARPEKLMDALAEIGANKHWIVTETYLSDQYGRRI